MSEIDDLEAYLHECEPLTNRHSVAVSKAFKKTLADIRERSAMKAKHVRRNHTPKSAEPSLPKFKCLED